MFDAQRRGEAFTGLGMNAFMPIMANASLLLSSLQKSHKAVAGESVSTIRSGYPFILASLILFLSQTTNTSGWTISYAERTTSTGRGNT